MWVYILIISIVSIPMAISIYKVVLKNSAINGANVKIDLLNEARMYVDNRDTYLANYKNHKDYALLESALGELVIAYHRYVQSILGTTPVVKTSSIDPYVAAGIGTSVGGLVGGIAMGVAAQRERDRVNAEISRFRRDYSRVTSAEGQVKYLVKTIRSIIAGSERSHNGIEEAERKAKKQRNVKFLIPIISGIAGILFVLLVFLVYRFAFAEKVKLGRDYKEANRYYNEGEYDKAIEIYEKLEEVDYKDASKKIMEAKYEKALSAYNNREYDKAFELFRNIEDYSNSAEMLNACCYGRGTEEYDKGNIHDAKLYFIKANGYADSNDLIIECKYQEAIQYLENGKRNAALNEFKDISDYKDSKDRINEIYFSLGEDAFADSQYEDAISYFELSGNNDESKKMIKKAEQYLEFEECLQKAVMFARGTPSLEKVESYIEGLPEEFIVNNKEAKAFLDAWSKLNKDIIGFCGTWTGYEAKHPERTTSVSISLKYEDESFYCSAGFHEWKLNEKQPNNNELLINNNIYEKYVLSPDKKTLKYYLSDSLVSVYSK